MPAIEIILQTMLTLLLTCTIILALFYHNYYTSTFIKVNQTKSFGCYPHQLRMSHARLKEVCDDVFILIFFYLRTCIPAEAEPTLNSSGCYPLVNFTRPFCQSNGITLSDYVYKTPHKQ